MRHISSSIEVRASDGFALSFLNTYFLEREPGTTTSQIRLAVPMGAQKDSPAVEKTVDIEAHLEKPADGSPQVLAITWRPQGGGPFPTFTGIVRCTQTAEERAILLIEGDYSPPGHIVGAVFDAAIGANIAQTTLERLLQTFRDVIETDYRRRMR